MQPQTNNTIDPFGTMYVSSTANSCARGLSAEPKLGRVASSFAYDRSLPSSQQAADEKTAAAAVVAAQHAAAALAAVPDPYGLSAADIGRQHSEAEFRLYIGHLPPDVTSEGLAAYFRQFGQLSDYIVMTDSQKKSRCFGFVTFADPAVAEIVLNSGPHILPTNLPSEGQVVVQRASPRPPKTRLPRPPRANFLHPSWYSYDVLQQAAAAAARGVAAQPLPTALQQPLPPSLQQPIQQVIQQQALQHLQQQQQATAVAAAVLQQQVVQHAQHIQPALQRPIPQPVVPGVSPSQPGAPPAPSQNGRLGGHSNLPRSNGTANGGSVPPAPNPGPPASYGQTYARSRYDDAQQLPYEHSSTYGYKPVQPSRRHDGYRPY